MYTLLYCYLQPICSARKETKNSLLIVSNWSYDMPLFINLDSVGVVLDAQYSRSGYSFCFDHGLQIGDKSHVFCHVRCKHLYMSVNYNDL